MQSANGLHDGARALTLPVVSAVDFASFVRKLETSEAYQGQVAAYHLLPARPALYAEPQAPLPPALQSGLGALGIQRLYTHQASAIDAVRQGANVVVVTGAASGKTLCYNLAVLEKLLADTDSTALYLFPTKALARDQLTALRELLRACGLSPDAAAPLDGDVAPAGRRVVRDQARIVLANPDILHHTVLPHHTRWARLLSHLQTVVIDEVHEYRGLFGSNVACVLRRLRRLGARHGAALRPFDELRVASAGRRFTPSKAEGRQAQGRPGGHLERSRGAAPQFICCSATISNPQQHAERLCGVPMCPITNDGASRSAKHVVLWNPPVIGDSADGAPRRRSGNVEAQELLTQLVTEEVRTIVFAKARVVAELICRYARQALQHQRPDLADRIAAYRGGYLPQERREIERRLLEGELLAVASTNALELGIDVGTLGACITVGFPLTIASTWQQAGRAGRQADESLFVLVAYDEPRDQYLMRHPEWLLEGSPESAVIDPENPYVLTAHLRCAAHEAPLSPRDEAFFGGLTTAAAALLQDAGELHWSQGAWHWAQPDCPATRLSLRTSAECTYSIVDSTRQNTPIGMVDGISGLELIHPGASYLHDGETYLVEDLDMEARVAYVVPAQLDYYTEAAITGQIVAGQVETQGSWRGNEIRFCEAKVTWRVVSFDRISFYDRKHLATQPLGLPPQELETTAFVLIPGEAMCAAARQAGRRPQDGLAGLRNVAVNVLPALAMCDRLDVGGFVDAGNLGRWALFLYDRYQGGLGLVQQACERTEELMRVVLELTEACDCSDGCPLCVGAPVNRPAIHCDPDLQAGSPTPDKQAALAMLRAAFGQRG